MYERAALCRGGGHYREEGTVAQLKVYGRVALQTVTALANLLRPPLPPDFPQNPFPVEAQIAEARESDGSAFGKTTIRDECQ